MQSTRILIVDDDPAARNGLAELLREEGYSVEVSSGGAEALARFEELRPFVVLGGVELMARIHERDPDRAVVVTTGDVTAALRQGAAAALARPFDAEQVRLAVERVVALQRLQDEVRRLREQLAQKQSLPPIPGSTLADLERYAILQTLIQCAGSTSRAADILGISARKIQYKLHEYADDTKGGIAELRQAARAGRPTALQLVGKTGS